MAYFDKYADALKAAGYRLKGKNVYDSRGNHAAMEDRFGTVYISDPRVQPIIDRAELEQKAKPKKAPAKKAATKKKETTENAETLEMVRARDENGHFIPDDPSTPDVNEAWVVKTVKKAIKKK